MKVIMTKAVNLVEVSFLSSIIVKLSLDICMKRVRAHLYSLISYRSKATS